MSLVHDDGADLIPKWQAEVMVDERLSQERDRIIRQVRKLKRYGHFKEGENRLVRLSEVIEEIERSN